MFQLHFKNDYRDVIDKSQCKDIFRHALRYIGDNIQMNDNDWVDQKFKIFKYKKYLKVMIKMQKSGMAKGEHLLMGRLKILAMIK